MQRAVLLATRFVARRADDAGACVGRADGGAGLDARLLLTLVALGLTEGDRGERLASRLLDSQLATGGWSAEPGGDADASVSVLAYLAVKRLRGPEALPAMAASRRAILALGGVASVGAEANAWLALFGEAEPRPGCCREPWRAALSVAPPLEADALHGVRELHLCGAESSCVTNNGATNGVANGATGDDRQEAPQAGFAGCSRFAVLLWRRLALRSDGDPQAIDRVERAIESLIHEEDPSGAMSLAPEETPERDTALVLELLAAAGCDDEARRAAEWLAGRAERVVQAGAATAAEVLRALARWRSGERDAETLPPRLRVVAEAVGGEPSDRLGRPSIDAAVDRLAAWLMTQQEPDGGWGGADDTGLVIEALIVAGRADKHRLIDRLAAGVGRLVSGQQVDGSWRSRLATDDVYAVSRAVVALAAAQELGVAAGGGDALQAGVNWLLANQAASGGWGEAVDATGVTNRSAAATPTAWALRALAAAGQHNLEACRRAVDFLLETQHDTGEWREPHFFLRSADGGASRNDLRPTIAAAGALAAWAAAERRSPAAEPEIGLRLVTGDTN